MPWKMTPENIAVLMKAMHGAPTVGEILTFIMIVQPKSAAC